MNKPVITEFSFGQVEAILAEQNMIARSKRTAFAGRLKALQKLGIPMREAAGRGRAATYSLDHLIQLSLGVELAQCGLPPLLISEIIKNSWFLVQPAVASALKQLRSLDEMMEKEEGEVFLGWAFRAHTQSLEDLMDLSPTRLEEAFLEVFRHRQFGSFLGFDTGTMNRQCRGIVINSSIFFTSLIAAIHYEMKEIGSEDIFRTYVTENENLELIADLADREAEIFDAEGLESERLKQIREEAFELSLRFPGTDTEIRALSFAISKDGHEEVRWALTPMWHRDKSGPPAGVDIERRRVGQRELSKLGLIEEIHGDDFQEPVLTELGWRLVRKFAVGETVSVHTQA